MDPLLFSLKPTTKKDYAENLHECFNLQLDSPFDTSITTVYTSSMMCFSSWIKEQQGRASYVNHRGKFVMGFGILKNGGAAQTLQLSFLYQHIVFDIGGYNPQAGDEQYREQVVGFFADPKHCFATVHGKEKAELLANSALALDCPGITDLLDYIDPNSAEDSQKSLSAHLLNLGVECFQSTIDEKVSKGELISAESLCEWGSADVFLSRKLALKLNLYTSQSYRPSRSGGASSSKANEFRVKHCRFVRVLSFRFFSRPL